MSVNKENIFRIPPYVLYNHFFNIFFLQASEPHLQTLIYKYLKCLGWMGNLDELLKYSVSK